MSQVSAFRAGLTASTVSQPAFWLVDDLGAALVLCLTLETIQGARTMKTKLRLVGGLTAGVILFAGLTGCGSSDKEETTETTKAAATATTHAAATATTTAAATATTTAAAAATTVKK